MLGFANERRAHFKRIFIGPSRADKHAVIPHCVDQVQSHRTTAWRRDSLSPYVDAKEEPGVSDTANLMTLRCELLQSGAEAPADRKRLLRNLVSLQDR